MFYMALPHCTVPYLLDDLAQRTRNAYRDQGGGAYFVLIDLDGRVAYADYHRQIPPHWGPEAVNFPYEFTTIRLNHLESRLRAFVDGGCRYGKHMDAPLPDWRLGKGRADDDVLIAHRQPTIWLAGRVAAVDPAKRILTIERHKPNPEEMPGLKFWQAAAVVPFDAGTKGRHETVRTWVAAGDGDRTYRFAVGETLDVFLDGRAVALADLRIGDQVGVWYHTRHEGQPHVPALQVRAYRVAP
jgi:hypothetical protein